MGSIPGQGTKLPHTIGQLSPHSSKYRAHTLWSPHATTRDLAHHKYRACTLQSPSAATHDPTKTPHAANSDPMQSNKFKNRKNNAKEILFKS